MAIYRVTRGGHQLVPGDLLFGGEYFLDEGGGRQYRFKAYGERGEDKGWRHLPSQWLRENIVISSEEPAREGPQERQFLALLQGRPPMARQASGAKANLGKLKGEGIPRQHAEAFLDAADKNHCVILTRTPGIVCGGLLNEGYDGKCFHIKGKSCNWGPMAGFVCLDPLLNKNGIYGALGNLENHYKSLTNSYEGNTAKVRQIKISQQRFDWLVKEAYIVPNASPDGVWYGEITQKHKDVPEFLGRHDTEIPYVLRKQPGEKLWSLYYNRAKLYKLYYPNIKTDWNDLLKHFKNMLMHAKAKSKDKKGLLWKPEHQRKFRLIHVEKTREHRGYEFRGEYYNPVLGLVNPHPPYPGANAYKNAVTGDYDLFAVWPHSDISNRDDLRMAGMRPSIQDREIFAGEHRDLGNISNRIYEIGQMVNSEIARRTNEKVKPNRVFHSDEAGRPCIGDLDLPAAAFVPSVIRERVWLIKDNREMDKFIELCHKNGYRIYANKGWLRHLKVRQSILSWG
jgi:hypothetical protein